MGAKCGCGKPKPTTLDAKYLVDYSEETGVLGQGTFAIVYAAQNRKSKHRVAVKNIDKANSRRDLLNTEIWILQNCGEHPNIVTLYDMYETEEHVQLVIEIMNGGELFDLLDDHGACAEADAVKYFEAMASGLAYLHEMRIAHRDLKPENLLLSSKGADCILKISDFGLAKILFDEDEMTVACGTWIYCAPEVLLLKQKRTGSYGIKCDVFSLGCILFILMAGYHPFDMDGNDDEELMQECILSDSWDFDDPAWAVISFTARELIENALRWDPADRLSAQDLFDHPWTQGKTKYGVDEKDGRASQNEPVRLFATPIGAQQEYARQQALINASKVGDSGTNDKTLVEDPSTAVSPKPNMGKPVPEIPQFEGTGGAPEVPEWAAGSFDQDGGTGGDVLSESFGPKRSRSAMATTNRNAPVTASNQPDKRRASLASLAPGRRLDGARVSIRKHQMPKKHVPHAGTRVELTKERTIGLALKGVGTTFDAEANESRWKKYRERKDAAVVERKEGRGGVRCSLRSIEEMVMSQPPPTAPVSAGPRAPPPEGAERASADAMSPGKTADSAAAPKPKRQSLKAKSKAKIAAGTEDLTNANASADSVNVDITATSNRQSVDEWKKSNSQTSNTMSVEEWKATRAPKLLKKSTGATESEGSPATKVKRPKSKVKGKAAAKKTASQAAAGEESVSATLSTNASTPQSLSTDI